MSMEQILVFPFYPKPFFVIIQDNPQVFQDYYASQVDQTNAEVVSVIMGDDSVDIADAKNLIKGGIYQLTDGEVLEEVQIKDNLGAIVNGYRILFTNNVANSYKMEKREVD